MSDTQDPTPDPALVAEVVDRARELGQVAWQYSLAVEWFVITSHTERSIVTILDLCAADLDVIDAAFTALGASGPMFPYLGRCDPADVPAATLLHVVYRRAWQEYRWRRERLLARFGDEYAGRYEELTRAEVQAVHAHLDDQARRRAA